MDKKIRKKLEDFIKDERGNISKDKVLKTGIGIAAALASFGAVSEVNAQHTNTHNNVSHGSAVAPSEECVDQDIGSATTRSHASSHSSSHSSY
jgi:hypothetical protein